jgi:hypothetical protein
MNSGRDDGKCSDCAQRGNFCVCILICCSSRDEEIRLAGALEGDDAPDEYCEGCRPGRILNRPSRCS